VGTNFVKGAGEAVHIFFFPVTRNEIVEMDVVKTIERRRYEKVHIVCSMSDKMIAFNLLVFLINYLCCQHFLGSTWKSFSGASPTGYI
jgi:hypothetical protein